MSSISPAEAATSSSGPSEAPPHDPLVQYVVIRKDLWTAEGWPLGSVVAQACHASTAAMYLFRDDPQTIEYQADVDHMHKVVLEVKDQAALRALSVKLDEAQILHKLWIEQPENVATSLASKPDVKSQLAPHFKKLALAKSKITP